ncbi:MAG TPA: hypothetical protein PKE25_10455, partial [Novosphingobium sp.]|nr:hypothetical protein [Novosphingobium sp.]
MARITIIDHAGSETTVEAAPGQTVMEAAKAHDIAGIEAVCGGDCYFGTRRGNVGSAWRAPGGPASGPASSAAAVSSS